MTAGSGWRAGLDLGSTCVKAVLIDASGSKTFRLAEPAGANPDETAERLLRRLMEDAGVSDAAVTATGYGRSLARGASRTVTEISCHAKGVRHAHPDAMAILDIGGQDAKAIRLGPEGTVEDFAMNDRCAAGTGCFLDVMARKFSLEIGELSAYCGDDPGLGDDDGRVEVSSTCVVFAESEVVGLLARGTPAREALRAVHRAIARRVAVLLKRVNACGPVYFSGGVAKNETLRLAVERETGLRVTRAADCQFAGAAGAALFARECGTGF